MGFFYTTLLLLCSASIALLLASPASAINHMLPGDTLQTGDSLFAANNTYRFTMQSDCNLVLYRLGKALWASHTYLISYGCHLTLQHDGNLVIFNFYREPIWKSNTNGEDGEYILILQKNGNVVLYNHHVWETETDGFIIAVGNATAEAGSSAARRKAKVARIASVTGDE